MRSKLFAVSICVAALAKAQDPQFTQFYASPMFLNPAFTGQTDEHRISGIYRRQWPGSGQSFTSYLAGYEYNVDGLNSGIGFFASQDKAGASQLVNTQFGGAYAYSVRLNRSTEIRAGLMMGVNQKKTDNASLVFNDQLITGSAVSTDFKTDRVNYIDLGTGVVLSHEKYWIGFSAKHINQPHISLTGSNQRLPVFYSLHGGYKFELPSPGTLKTQERDHITAAFQYRNQLMFNQLDIGAYYTRSFISAGLWYRGLPFVSTAGGFHNNESIALMLGLSVPDNSLRIAYSYDLTVSKLGLNNTFGSHEVTLVFEAAKTHKKKRHRFVSCPKF